jgi:hypothetical protein
MILSPGNTIAASEAINRASNANPFIELSEEDKPFVRSNQSIVDLLEGITSAEKAQAVPFIRLWQISPEDGLPVNRNSDGAPAAPLSLHFSRPPAFGSSVDQDRFRERPNVSLERIVIKYEQLRGTMLFRQFEIDLVSHNPTFLFSKEREEDSWSTLLIPGTVHALEYGWSASNGVRNEILRGDDFVDKTVKPVIVIPGRMQARFTVIDYSFNIEVNGQIKIKINAVEAGEFNLRRAVPTYSSVMQNENRAQERNASKTVTIQAEPIAFDPKTKEGQLVLKNIQSILSSKLKPDSKGFVEFKSVCDMLFSDALTKCYTSCGFNTPSLYIGKFNEKTGMTSDKYNSIDLSNQSIGAFKIPLKEVREVFAKAVCLGDQLTLYNFMMTFFNIINNMSAWNQEKSKNKEGTENKDVSIPEICFRTIAGKKDANVFIFDKKREFIQWEKTQYNKEAKKLSREDIRANLKINNIPMISFGKGNSYIAGSNFSAIADPTIKTIFMRKGIDRSRSQQIGQSDAKGKDVVLDYSDLLYSSAINGDITMLGNFAFDVFGTVWLDFGVDQWSGPFWVMNKEDIISATEFISKITFNSTGTDPLNTQGRQAINQAKQELEEEKKQKDKNINKKGKKKKIAPAK